MSRNRTVKILMFGVFSLVLGAAAGAVVWIVVSLANLGIMLLWDLLPKAVGVTAENSDSSSTACAYASRAA